MRNGVALARPEAQFARSLGIVNPDSVRLLKVDAIRAFEHPLLRAATSAIDLRFRHTAGLTLRYGILIRSDCWDQSRLVAHELVHVHQYERLGGIRPFLRSYFHECLVDGYPFGPLEQEAVTLGRTHSRS